MSGGLYNVLFGTHRTAKMVLEALGVSRLPFCFRDAWYDGDADELVIYGRPDWSFVNHDLAAATKHIPDLWLPSLPGFLGYAPDPFDATYWYFRYQVPAHRLADFHVLRENGYGAPPSPAKRWRELLAGIKANDLSNPAVRRALSLRRQKEVSHGRRGGDDARGELSRAGGRHD